MRLATTDVEGGRNVNIQHVMDEPLSPQRPSIGDRSGRRGPRSATDRHGAVGWSLLEVPRKLARFRSGHRQGRKSRTDPLPRKLLNLRERSRAVAKARLRERQL